MSFEAHSKVLEGKTYDREEPTGSQSYPVQPFGRLNSNNEKEEGLDREKEVLSRQVARRFQYSLSEMQRYSRSKEKRRQGGSQRRPIQ